MKPKVLHIALIVIALMLSAAVAAQESPLRFDAKSHDFGPIREIDGKVSHTFSFVNTSDKPVVIIAVQTSCGCTVPEYSKRPVMPGAGGEITLTYNPADRPGPFTRDADVYGADRKVIATLRIEGNVEPRPRRVDELYPFDLGGGVRASASFVPFGYVSHGETKQSYIDIVNTSPRAVDVEVRLIQESGLLRFYAPSRLAAGAKGEIRMEYSVPSCSGRYMTADDSAQLLIEGRAADIQLTANAIVVERYDPSAQFPAPQAQLNKNIANFGAVKHSAPVQRMKFVIANGGGDALTINAVECTGESSEAVATTLRSGMQVEGGESAEFDVVLRPDRADYGFMTVRLRIFTDDPVRPMRQIRVTATVEE